MSRFGSSAALNMYQFSLNDILGEMISQPSLNRLGSFRFIDLFCGIGGIRLGMERAGFECVFSCDINDECKKTYNANFGEIPHGDITDIPASIIPDFDILCAGFPCQPFSISGKQKGFGDKRGILFFEICRIIEEKQPPVVFLENVKHLIHHDSGRTLKIILEQLRDLGYDVVGDY